ncbi:MAG: zinc ribbon domain-containing protein [Fibrobacteria bacterium]|nr:zinc ribbon domain-containing protein [Fibrobacteria bacterium]
MTSFQMLWDCPRCGTRGLLGVSHRHCPSCGTAQDPAKRYFPEPGSEVEALGHQWVGVDRSCPYCQSPNSAKAVHCVNCGSNLDGASEVGLVQDGGAALEPPPDRNPPPPPPRKGRPWWPWVVGIVVLAGLAIFWSLRSSPRKVEVVSRSWERSISVERFGPLSSGSWCDEVPGDASTTGRSSRQRSTRSVEDGQTCSDRRVDQGDGSFRVEQECHTNYREEPIYDDWCSWTAMRWQFETRIVARGGEDTPPRWPAFEPSGSGIGALREAGREEIWPVVFRARDGEKQWTCRLPSELGTRCRLESRWILPVRRVGGAVCSQLKPAVE